MKPMTESVIVQTGLKKAKFRGSREKADGDRDLKSNVNQRSHFMNNCFDTHTGELRRMTVNFLGGSSKACIQAYL